MPPGTDDRAGVALDAAGRIVDSRSGVIAEAAVTGSGFGDGRENTNNDAAARSSTGASLA